MCEPGYRILVDVDYLVVGNFLICRFACVLREHYIWRVRRELSLAKLSQHTEFVYMSLSDADLGQFDRDCT